ncbi:uncharacterized protein LOC130743033 [Lotus japonicus]|uniref:uncharacterized protein LOC130743033 n=1 Tax=Lotus japonicus TaxID=34305 RepID=UPI002586EE59|nr:uncharacterized protein LOC130743033 [Lotus japonicus]
MPIADEIFGPVMALMKFNMHCDQEPRHSKHCVKSIHAGIIWINCYFAFGRDFGMEALYKYLQVKSVAPSDSFSHLGVCGDHSCSKSATQHCVIPKGLPVAMRLLVKSFLSHWLKAMEFLKSLEMVFY